MKTVMKKNSNLMLILSCGLLMVAALPVEGFFFFDIPLWFQQPCIFTCTNPNSNATSKKNVYFFVLNNRKPNVEFSQK